MDKAYINKITADFTENSPTNYLSPIAKTEEELERLKHDFYANNFGRTNASSSDWAILNKDKPDEYVGMRFYNAPIFAYGDAADEGFKKLKEPGVVGPHHFLPENWVPGAKTVISMFVPFTERVIKSNTVDPVTPSWEWRYARIDGQQHLLALGALIRDALIEAGYNAVMPYSDEAFWAKVHDDGDNTRPVYSSNWSERHVGYVTGLGTFGLMTNFISKAGNCGRLNSVVTDWQVTPDVKDYEGIFDYCSGCKACYRACPGDAFSDEGKSIDKCQQFIRQMSLSSLPRVGCGKCMSGMPCQTRSFSKTGNSSS